MSADMAIRGGAMTWHFIPLTVCGWNVRTDLNHYKEVSLND